MFIYSLIPLRQRMLMNHTNQTEEDLFSCYSPSVVGYRYFAVLWGCAVTIIGTLGNLMTILAFALDPRLRTRFNALIINLAVADLLYCTILQPMSVDSYLHLRWRSGQLWCSIFGLLLFLSNSVSIITLCLVAVSRYLLVVKRAMFDRIFSNHGLILLLMSVWALGLASFGPLWPVYVFVPQVCTCSFHRTRGRPYTTILLFVYFIVGLGCVAVFYLLIYRRVMIASKALVRYRFSRRSSRRKAASSSQGTNDSGVETGIANTCSCELSNQEEQTQNKDDNVKKSSSKAPVSSAAKMSSSNIVPATTTPITPASSGDDREFKRVTRMCFTVFLCFAFCFVPFLLLNIADRHNSAPKVLHMLSANLTWLNSCINPVLYAVMNRQFRQAYHMLFTRLIAPFTCPRSWRWHLKS
ncbi:G-protein coupled receptor 84 [Tautogolabrus adspersus]